MVAVGRKKRGKKKMNERKERKKERGILPITEVMNQSKTLKLPKKRRWLKTGIEETAPA